MKKSLLKVLSTGMLLFALASCDTQRSITYTAGSILENPKDNLTSVERNNNRSKVIADQMWKDYYDE